MDEALSRSGFGGRAGWPSILTPRGSILVLGLLAWGGCAAASAQAASTIFVDDSRDGVQCPGALDIVDLFTLVPFPIENGQTLIFCSGEYHGTLFIDGVRNVTITGKADPVLGPPRIIPVRSPTSLGTVLPDLISVKNSTNVTISDMSLDGAPKGSTTTNSNPALTDMNGIHVVNSSVTITDNTISRIHPQTPNTPGGIAILVDGSAQAAQQVNVVDNTLFDFNESGVLVHNVQAQYRPTITGNVIWTRFDGTTTTTTSATSRRASGRHDRFPRRGRQQHQRQHDPGRAMRISATTRSPATRSSATARPMRGGRASTRTRPTSRSRATRSASRRRGTDRS